MKLITKFFLILLMLAINSAIQAQERVNRLPIEIKKVSSLTRANGYMFNAAGQWEFEKNTIPWKLSDNNISLKAVPYYALGSDNFKEYAFYTSEFNTKPFAIFIKHFTSGQYLYPNIKKGWIDGTYTEAYAIEMSELEKLKNIENGKLNRVEILAFDYKNIEMKSPSQALSIIKQSLGQLPRGTKAHLYFDIFPDLEKGVTQFQIYNEIEIGSMRLKGGTRNNWYIDGVGTVYGTDKLFESSHFEAEFADFDKFIKAPL